MSQHTIEFLRPTAEELFEADEPELEEIAIRVECDGALNDLFNVIRAAANDLDGQGAKSDRIAQQLLTGLATFCKETGCL